MQSDSVRRAGSSLAEGLYRLARPLIFRRSPDSAHELAMRALATLDRLPVIANTLGNLTRAFLPTEIGGVHLPSPVMVGAGLVKGHGFSEESSALEAITSDVNIMPGLSALPRLGIPVELGSFTRQPRPGNPPPVLWRDVPGKSLQNRVGLKNPGARAAAAFIAAHPPEGSFGISLATTPGLNDPSAQRDALTESAEFFRQAGVRPSWLTVNLSCPNTETDPLGNQSGQLAYAVCEGLRQAWPDVSLWVKIGPDLSESQLVQLVDVFGKTGVQAVIATNTVARPVPTGTGQAGLSGRGLQPLALDTVRRLKAQRDVTGAAFRLIGCGGIMDASDVYAYTEAGADAVQIWSAMVFRGLLAASAIAHEMPKIPRS
jgi:dihydroorotate dehydrogenase